MTAMWYLFDGDAGVIFREFTTEAEALEEFNYLMSVDPYLDIDVTQDITLR